MTKEDVFEAATEIFHEVFDDDSITITESTVASDIEDWDSLEHINLVLALEKRFDIKFTMDEVLSMKNVGDMVNIVMKRGRI